MEDGTGVNIRVLNLFGKTIGFVGLGNIGKLVAERGNWAER